MGYTAWLYAPLKEARCTLCKDQNVCSAAAFWAEGAQPPCGSTLGREVYQVHLTKSEQQIMEIFWKADHAMAQTEVVSTCVERKWKERSIFSMLNSLMEKGVLREVGFVRSGKTYARTFEPAMSHAEYLAAVVAEQLPAKQLPELLAALMQKMETTPAIQKEMRAALRENTQ